MQKQVARLEYEQQFSIWESPYYAVNTPQLRIQQIYDVDATGINTDRLYWVVQSSNGTTYRLGYTPDSETGQTANHNIIQVGTTQHAGYLAAYGSIRWRVDTVTNVYGNHIQYDDYKKVLSDETYTGTNRQTIVTSTTAIISQIRYNYQNLASSPTTQVTDGSYATRIDFVRWTTEIWEYMVVVWQADNPSIRAEYHLQKNR